MKLKYLNLGCALALAGNAAFAQDKVQQPSFLPADKVYYTSECHAPFRGWVDPLRSHLVIVASSTDFRDAETVDANLQQCLKNTSIWMTTSGNTGQPVRFELTDMTGRVLLEQTLSFGG